MSAAASASSSTRPAGPTKGEPCRSSWSPGCSPTSMIWARTAPSPKTVWVASLYRRQLVQSAASRRTASNSAARPAGRLTRAPESANALAVRVLAAAGARAFARAIGVRLDRVGRACGVLALQLQHALGVCLQRLRAAVEEGVLARAIQAAKL